MARAHRGHPGGFRDALWAGDITGPRRIPGSGRYLPLVRHTQRGCDQGLSDHGNHRRRPGLHSPGCRQRGKASLRDQPGSCRPAAAVCDYSGPDTVNRNGLFKNLIAYFGNLPALSNPFGREDANYSQGWTAFYYAWWIAWSPSSLACSSRGSAVAVPYANS